MNAPSGPFTKHYCSAECERQGNEAEGARADDLAGSVVAVVALLAFVVNGIVWVCRWVGPRLGEAARKLADKLSPDKTESTGHSPSPPAIANGASIPPATASVAIVSAATPSAVSVPQPTGDVDEAAMGQQLVVQGRCADAIPWLERALQKPMESSEKSILLTTIGNCFNRLQQFDKSLEYHELAIREDPKNHRAYVNKGVVYRLMGDYDKAAEAYTKARELAPDYVELYQSMAALAIAQGEYDTAIEHSERAIELNSSHPTGYSNLAVAYASTGRFDEAYEQLRKAVLHGHPQPEVIKNRIDQLRIATNASASPSPAKPPERTPPPIHPTPQAASVDEAKGSPKPPPLTRKPQSSPQSGAGNISIPPVLIILSLVLCFPIGFVLIWIQSDWDKQKKIKWTAIAGSCVVGVYFCMFCVALLGVIGESLTTVKTEDVDASKEVDGHSSAYRELHAQVGTPLEATGVVQDLCNPSLQNVKCLATDSELDIEFDVDTSKWETLGGTHNMLPLLVCLFDSDGSHLTRFTTVERFTVHRDLYESEAANQRVRCYLLVPTGNRLVYEVDTSYLRDAAIVEIGFYEE